MTETNANSLNQIAIEEKKKPTNRWIWNQVIRENTVNLLCAEQSHGKSMLALQLCKETLKAKRNDRMLLDIPVYALRGNVLYISTEMSKSDIKNRLSQLGVDNRMKAFRDHFFVSYHPDNLTINVIKEEIKQVNAKFVVIDILQGLANGEGCEMNDYNSTNILSGMLRAITNCTFLLVHHMNKSGKIMGSTGIAAAMDTRIELLEINKDFDSKTNKIILNQSCQIYGKQAERQVFEVAFNYPEFTIIKSTGEEDVIDNVTAQLMEQVIALTSGSDKEGNPKEPIEGTYQEVAARLKMISKYQFSPRKFSALLTMNKDVLNGNGIQWTTNHTRNGTTLKIWYSSEENEWEKDVRFTEEEDIQMSIYDEEDLI